MTNKIRNTAGKFAPKSEAPRKVRSVNLTDDAWQWLATVAEAAGVSRNDYLEALADGSHPLMETVKSQVELSGGQMTEQPDIKNVPLMETVQSENEELRRQLENSDHLIRKLKEEVQKLRSQLATERADREEIEVELADLAQIKKEAKEAAAEIHREGNALKLLEVRWQGELSDAKSELADTNAIILKQNDKIRELERGYSLKPNPKDAAVMREQRLEIGNLRAELADLKQNSALARRDLLEAADLLNQLKAKRKKSTASLFDVEILLEMIEG